MRFKALIVYASILCAVLLLSSCRAAPASDAAASSETDASMLVGAELTMDDLIAEDGSAVFPYMTPETDTVGFEAAAGMSRDEYSALMRGEDGEMKAIMTIEGISVAVVPKFDSKSGLVYAVAVYVVDTGETQEVWDAFSQAVKRFSGATENGNTGVSIQYCATDGSTDWTDDTPRRVQMILLAY